MRSFISPSAVILTVVSLRRSQPLGQKNFSNRVAPWPHHFQGPGPPSQMLSELGISLNSKGEGGGRII